MSNLNWMTKACSIFLLWAMAAVALPAQTFTKLFTFDGTDGAYHVAVLVQDTDGNLHGTTEEAGASDTTYPGGCGAVFTITLSGTLTMLRKFDGSNGFYPYAGLAQPTNGTIYGTTPYNRGINGDDNGTIFSLSVGLNPFLETQPTSGAVGATVNVLGTKLTGTTGVTSNGTPAVFTVVSQSLITTTVPASATTGTVQVVTPNGKGLSNVPFTVLP
jgi:hypothetical protein